MNVRKSYSDFINEISSEEIFEGLLAHGLFSDRLPPIFTGENFFQYCRRELILREKQYREELKRDPEKKTPEDWWAIFPKKSRGYVHYETMRNINIPRSLGIPHPGAYFLLCRRIQEDWERLQQYFERKTKEQEYLVGRIFLRKKKNGGPLFEMNYKNWKTDGTPEDELLFYQTQDAGFKAAKFLVRADISACFPSIYTHSLGWALEEKGKKDAKSNARKHIWYNELDLHARNTKLGETHGLLIGPHTSNLLAEIILTSVDAALYRKGWRYVRNIDDYRCYVANFEEARLFLTELGEELRKYGLALNHKKTVVSELPQATNTDWVRKINVFNDIYHKGALNYNEIRSYLDFAVELMRENDGDAAILKYLVKTLAKRQASPNAVKYYVRYILHLTIIYPYLISLLDDFVFTPFKVSTFEISMFSNLIYNESVSLKQYEAVCYAIYFAIKYEFKIDELDVVDAINSGDCLFLLLSFLYFKQNKETEKTERLKRHACALIPMEVEDFWIFAYEALTFQELRKAFNIRNTNDFGDEWIKMKEAKVTFLKDIK